MTGKDVWKTKKLEAVLSPGKYEFKVETNFAGFVIKEVKSCSPVGKTSYIVYAVSLALSSSLSSLMSS